MKRILLACFMLTATCSVTFVQQATARMAAPAPVGVTNASFTAKVNTMDAQIGAGNMTAAQATWNEIHQMELTVLATSKSSIQAATTPADKASHMEIMNNQYSLYKEIWDMKTDLAANRSAIHSKLISFAGTIY